ncbi:MAG TPA: phage tail sheath C-terminal domain-containing protein [Sphingomicrobium sp.]|nr:phage tail sheath C-terminal domain-containing protein [Sphingomicrobium sp.]
MLLEGYPGVYLQEVPSGVRTIIAASTSTLAIIGHFPRGPVGKPIKVTSWSDVVRNFGALDRRYVALYALQDFFLQGGTQAWVNRVAFERPTVTLMGVDKAFTVEAKTPGTVGDGIQVSVKNNVDGSFDMRIANGSAVETITRLSSDPASARFVERIVNAPATEGGSAAVQVSNTRFPPADVAQASPAVLANGAPGVRSSATIKSKPFPALTLQGLSGWTAATRVEAAAGTNSGFKLTFSGLSGSNVVRDDLTVNNVVSEVSTAQDGSNPIAAVVIGRQPLRSPLDLSGTTPAAANSGPLAGTAPGLPAVATTAVPRVGSSAKAMDVSAASPGDWGNNLRIGIATTPAGYDLLINEYRGNELVASETFRGLSATATDAQFGPSIVNEQSRLIRIQNVATAPRPTDASKGVDELTAADLTPLAGGSDGTLPGEPAWADAAASVFGGTGENIQGAQGIRRFDEIIPELINIMIVPEAPLMTDKGFATYAAAGSYCAEALAFLLVDHPVGNDSLENIGGWDIAGRLGSDLARSAALCFPRLDKDDPLGGKRKMQSSGAIAGLMARTDGQRGVWKAPAGLDASIGGMIPTVKMTDRQQASLNKSGLNCLRVKPGAGTVQWGARTLAGADILASEWKYVPVRRTALMIEQTLKGSLTWVVFEPNDESLWAQIRLNVGAFMQSLFVQGAFQGATPREAYLVKCDGETTSQQDVNAGIVNILVGFAPLKPAEFVVVRLTQLAGRLAN